MNGRGILRALCPAAPLVAALLAAAGCSRGKNDAARDAAARSGGQGAESADAASAFVWPLAPPADGGEARMPRKGMIWIPGGTLLAGTAKDRTPRVADEEMAGEAVEMAGFYIDEFAYPNEVGAIPKTGITRDEAAGLCAALDKRLCTELEWERACKGPGNATYEYGESYRAAECTMGLAGRLAPSGLRVGCRSAFGVHDLHGGPWEWTASAWRRGDDTPFGVARGGNSDAGELVGRCANAMALPPATRRADLGARCCAGEPNKAEVRLAVARAKTLEARPSDAALMASLADAMREKALPDVPNDVPFRVDRVWLWRPVGNEELVVAAGCARRQPHLSCGVGVFRAHVPGGGAPEGTPPSLMTFASSGWWMAVVKADHRNHDLWVYGGDGTSSFRRRVAYVWGKVALGESERATASTPLP